MKKTALSRKPSRSGVNDADVLAVIEKGGSSTTREESRGPAKDRAMNLRIPGNLAQLMDQALEERTVRISKNTWILEAIAEKAHRDLQQD